MSEGNPIPKTVDPGVVPPNLRDYEQARREQSWDEAWRDMAAQPDDGLNMAYQCVTRHVHNGAGERPALRAIAADGSRRTFTYAELEAASNRFANVLRQLGVGPGERVFCLLGRVPEVHVVTMGTFKQGAVFCPLFTAYGPEPIRTRAELGQAKVVVTTPALYKRKVQSIRAELPDLEHVLLVGSPEVGEPGVHDLNALMDGASTECEPVPTAAETPALLHFTSGTTGQPKGALHVHEAVVAQQWSGRLALDLYPGDHFWCTADPGWVTGIAYGVVAPLAIGATLVLDEREFDVQQWIEVLREQRVNVWYTAPTAVRMMMRAGVASGSLPELRLIASVGEPLSADAVHWGEGAFGLPIHDNWWQTETGAIMIANYRSMPIKPGSMGRPLPGVEAAVIERRDGPGAARELPVGEVGELALRAGWPSMFRTYVGAEDRYRRSFDGDWYRTGDLARQDEDGYFWFVGRADDVIKSAGHLIGPFEVESAMLAHPAVSEAAVVGRPDPTIGQVVKAYVVLAPGRQADEATRRELIGHGRKRLGPAVAPKEVEFLDELPKTRSGKILRRMLRDDETPVVDSNQRGNEK